MIAVLKREREEIECFHELLQSCEDATSRRVLLIERRVWSGTLRLPTRQAQRHALSELECYSRTNVPIDVELCSRPTTIAIFSVSTLPVRSISG